MRKSIPPVLKISREAGPQSGADLGVVSSHLPPCGIQHIVCPLGSHGRRETVIPRLEGKGPTMNGLVRIPMKEGDGLVMEVEEIQEEGGMLKASADFGERVFEATVDVEDLLQRLKKPLKAVVEKLRDLAEPRPQQVEVEFGFTFSAEVGFVVAKGSTGANFKVKLSWKDEGK